jgi:hypothetical protein
VDLRLVSLGERIAAASGAVLFVLTFVPWLEETDAAGGTRAVSAWSLFSIVDVLVALLALVVVALPIARAAGAELPIRPSNKEILTRIGLVVLVVTVAFFLEGDKAWGIWLAVLASAGILYGAMTMPEEEERSVRRRERTRRPLAEENFEEPPPGMEHWRERAGHPGEEEEPASERKRGLAEEGPLGAPDRGSDLPWDEEEPRREQAADRPEPRRERDLGRSEPSTEVRGRRRPPEVPPSEDR